MRRLAALAAALSSMAIPVVGVDAQTSLTTAAAPDVPIELVFTPVEGAYRKDATIAEHGIPYDNDAHVPVIFYGPWVTPGRYTERALVADMAPTLARIAGVPPTEKLDGRVLEQVLQHLTPP